MYFPCLGLFSIYRRIFVKNKLSNFANAAYHKLWVANGCPANIMIYDLDLGCHGALREKRYETPGYYRHNGKFYDWVHMRGPLDVRHFTNGIIRFVRTMFPATPDRPIFARNNIDQDYHKGCPQTLFSQQFSTHHSDRSSANQGSRNSSNYSSQPIKGYRKNHQQKQGFQHRNNQRRNYQDNPTSVIGDQIYNVPVYNRFSENY